MQEKPKTRNERDALGAQLVELEMRYKRCECQASCLMEPNFADRLTGELLKLPGSASVGSDRRRSKDTSRDAKQRSGNQDRTMHKQ